MKTQLRKFYDFLHTSDTDQKRFKFQNMRCDCGKSPTE